MSVSINRSELRDKIYGCWTGKNIGGTLGGPYELRRELLDVKGYSTPAGEPMPNDDLDLQLVWLRALQNHGPLAVNAAVLGEYWLDFIPPHWNEYGVNKANQRAGLSPPLCGEYRNAWKHSNGAWIRTEIWACTAPGCPDIAMKYAYEDACVDHGGGEGTYAALFIAAIQSAAFVIGDRDELIEIGLSRIPADCRVARSVRIVLDAHASGKTWQEARELVLKDSDDLGWFQAPANIGFTIIGWMYGEGDFGKSLLIAVNCGDDTDCTAATLGAILGIIYGRSGIPVEWMEPIGDRIFTIAINTGNMVPRPPATCSDLTDQVMELVPSMLSACNGKVSITDGDTDLSGLAELQLDNAAIAERMWERSPYSVIHDFIHTRVTLDYGREPDVRPGEPFELRLSFWNLMPSPRHLRLKWHLPSGWTVLSPNSTHIYLRNEDVYGQEAAEMTVSLLPGEVCEETSRGILEVIAEGRPTVGLVPLVFFDGSSC